MPQNQPYNPNNQRIEGVFLFIYFYFSTLLISIDDDVCLCGCHRNIRHGACGAWRACTHSCRTALRSWSGSTRGRRRRLPLTGATTTPTWTPRGNYTGWGEEGGRQMHRWLPLSSQKTQTSEKKGCYCISERTTTIHKASSLQFVYMHTETLFLH